MNTPYVKKLNLVGECTNPITVNQPYVSQFKNRRQRREGLNRFMNNRNTNQMVVFGKYRYSKSLQKIGDKVIKHYVLVK